MLRSLLTNRSGLILGTSAWLCGGIALVGAIARHPHTPAAVLLTFLGWFVGFFFLFTLLWAFLLAPLRPRPAPSRIREHLAWTLPFGLGGLSIAACLYLPQEGVAERLHQVACFVGGSLLYFFTSSLIAGTIGHWARLRGGYLEGGYRPRPFDPNDPRQQRPFRLH